MSALAQAQWVRVQQVREARRYTGNSTVPVEYGALTSVVPELTPVVQYEGAPWLVVALEELRALKQAGVNIPTLGDFRIAEETMDHVRQLLTVEAVQSLAKPQIVPFSGGGISVVWNVRNKELSFSVYPGDDEVTFMMGATNEPAADDGVVRPNENRDLAAVVSRFLSSAA
jgi:hypothetical protein